jgi:hypothetical protein
MVKLTYLVGDATNPKDNGKNIIIPHVCNNIGGWGAGFVLALSKKWPEPEKEYRNWYQKSIPKHYPHDDNFSTCSFQLGATQLVKVKPNIYVANMIAQHGTISSNNLKPIKYVSLIQCMKDILYDTIRFKAEIHAPRFGSALAGGNWNFIEELIQEIWLDNGIDVYIYDLPRR